ncbi:SRPBCC family protein [Iamia majanohamensis]|uniref:SRPBCC family protein n=1 Tax=Iamia majanohamensis TaxID=467976 RepID=A0AAF0BSK2_9ACTN|nr:SRPBCC family protein [Iamia majanohamensis]WCO68451.1 SRPBCC family protein [Iamia majanohamensis]
MNENPAPRTRPATVSLRESVVVAVPAEVAWRIVAHQERDPEWRHGVREMRTDPPGEVVVGSRSDEVITVAGRTYRNVGRIDRVEPGRSFTWHTTEGADAHGSRTVRPLGDARCEVTLELHVRPSGLDRLLAPVTGRVLARSLRRDGHALAALARHEASAPVA